MSGFTVYYGKDSPIPQLLKNNLNDSGNLCSKIINDDEKYFISYFNKKDIYKENRIFENDSWIILVAGEIIDCEKLPFKWITDLLEKEKFKGFSKFKSVFAIGAYNKISKKYYLISDFSSQYPVFYTIGNNSLCFSTELNIFTKILKNPEFNEEWLYEFMAYNFPLGNRTFLKNVNRMPWASVLIYDAVESNIKILQYEETFSKAENLLNGDESLEFAREIFNARIPIYYKGVEKLACALTSGWDGRTILALAPDYNKVTAYTYGIPQCNDISMACLSSDEAGINHLRIHFDKDFVNKLTTYTLETVYLSSGLQTVLRSTLPFIYSKLEDFDVALSGLMLDGFFRGHLGITRNFPKPILKLFTGDTSGEYENEWIDIFKTGVSEFKNVIEESISDLRNILGDLTLNENHLKYSVYITSPRYFAGEFEISKNYTSLRVPGWDKDIKKLAFSIAESCLSFSEISGHKRNSRDEMILQAYLISKLGSRFKHIRTRNTTPSVVLKGEIPFQFYKLYTRFLDKSKRIINEKNKHIPLEDWNDWINNVCNDQMNELVFDSNSFVKNYFTQNYLDKTRLSKVYYLKGKLLTIEIILRLINTRWEKFW